MSLTTGGQPMQDGLFIWDEADNNCHLRLRYADGRKEITATETDYFEAMRTIRISLELEGLLPICYGASRGTFPSRMGRDMGLGLQVYRSKLGETARTVDLVSIFASGPDVEPTTVMQQQAFYEDWLESLDRRPA